MFTLADYRRLLDEFAAASRRRAAAERQLAAHFGGDDSEDRKLADRLASLQALRTARQEELTAERDAVLAAAAQQHAEAVDQARATQRQAEAAAIATHERAIEELERDYSDKTWVVGSLLDDDADDSPQRRLDRLVAAYDATEQTQMQGEQSVAAAIAAAPGVSAERPAADPQVAAGLVRAKPAALEQAHRDHIASAEDHLAAMRSMRLGRMVRGWRMLIPTLLLGGSAAAGAWQVGPDAVGVGATDWPTVVAAIGGGAGLLTLIFLGVVPASRRSGAASRAMQSVANAAWIREAWQKRITPKRAAEIAELQVAVDEQAARREAKQSQMAGRRSERETELRRQRDDAIAHSEQTLEATLAKAAADLQSQRETIDAESQRRMDESGRELREQIINATESLDDYRTHRSTEISELESRMTRGWTDSLASFRAAVESARTDAAVAGWNRLADRDWTPPRQLPRGLRIGTFECPLAEVPEAVSERAALALPSASVALPAVLPFPSVPSAVFRGRGVEARHQGTQALQVALLRAFTQIPPGKVRCTLLDPVGLGEAFAGFMHLADVDERLVSGRVWTQTQQIETQLANLTDHMENVLQTYLRGDFDSIEEYNHKAGEVAEPYRLLVVAGFPHRFSEVAWRRLVSIAASGPRCGVFLLLTHDLDADMPHGAKGDDLLDHAELFTWDGEHYRPGEDAAAAAPLTASSRGLYDDDADDADDPDPSTSAEPPPAEPPPVDPLRRLTLTIDSVPEPGVFTQIVRNVATASIDAGRVEVAFARVAPDERWTETTRDGLDIPLGRAGATKLQHARFGRGTAQHMLVAGKTGSGKSTFLHALVTSAAMRYSPDEIRFYLIDFKKGVEFKAYAGGVSDLPGGERPLPHADVIAIESEREFGVSALRRLDEVLDNRGERFRELGVQDVAGFRKARPDEPMPRILLLIDEFQEFFIEDDKLSQEATLLLDRLVRQGRAFGVHCVLGSQTLGGAYGLPRSTLGQIGIRVALQCSEADSHLIMAEDNTAARLLGRPGEAIYNDQGGLAAGNQPFQVAWLPDDDRADRIAKLAVAAAESGFGPSQPVIFEGDKPARLATSDRVRRLLAGETLDPPGRLRLDLGDAVEIKPPSGVDLLRQGGRNVLAVGPAGDLIRGMLAAIAVQRAIQPDAARSVLVLRDKVTSGDVWDELAAAFPDAVAVFDPYAAGDAVAELAAAMAERTGPASQSSPARLLIVDGVGQFRSLARPDDDFGFSRSPKPSSPLSNPLSNPLAAFADSAEAAPEPVADPGEQFAALLHDGPERGLFTIAYADAVAATDRIFGRRGLAEFSLRVLSQINGNASSQLIESPAASRLEGSRALLYHVETGQIEKFRPYGRPDLAALSSSDADDVEPQPEPAASTNEPDLQSEAADSPISDALDLDQFLVQ